MPKAGYRIMQEQKLNGGSPWGASMGLWRKRRYLWRESTILKAGRPPAHGKRARKLYLHITKDSDLGRSRAISITPTSQWREVPSFRDAYITKWAHCLLLCPATPYPLDSNLVKWKVWAVWRADSNQDTSLRRHQKTRSRNYAAVMGLPGARKNHSKYFANCVKSVFAKEITKVQKLWEFFSYTGNQISPQRDSDNIKIWCLFIFIGLNPSKWSYWKLTLLGFCLPCFYCEVLNRGVFRKRNSRHVWQQEFYLHILLPWGKLACFYYNYKLHLSSQRRQ